MDNSALQSALAKLDIGNDNHWTADGQPRLDTVKMLAGNPAVTRDAVEAVAPGYSRANAATYTWPDAPAAGGAAVESAGGGAGGTETESPAAAGAAAPVAAPVPAGAGDSGSTFSQNEPEQPPLDGGSPGAEDDIASLEAQLAEADAALEEVNQALDLVTKEHAKRTKHRDNLIDRLTKVKPPENPMSTIQAYVARQHELAMARAQQRQAIVGSGVNLQELTKVLRKGSPLDQAMARRTGRGGNRPNIGKV